MLTSARIAPGTRACPGSRSDGRHLPGHARRGLTMEITVIDEEAR
jgi:hypothetical protein